MSSSVVTGLCEPCSKLEISCDSFTKDANDTNRAHILGNYGEIQARSDECALCALICKAFREGPVPHGARREGQWTLHDLGVTAFWSFKTSEPKWKPSLSILLAQYAEDVKTGLMISLLNGGNIVSRNVVRQLGSRMDIDIVRGWLQTCELEHECVHDYELTTGPLSTPADFRVIDVQAMCIVVPPSRARYTALSYVWGEGVKFTALKRNIEQLSQPGGLDEIWNGLSPTIQDAITLTRNLGEKFLWVDALCIIQDANNAAALYDMGKVYSQALFTICAANDNASTDGLPGLSAKRSVPQWTQRISPDLELIGTFDPRAYLDLTSYRTRGWTFQEEQFAGRKLVFVNNQAHFLCSKTVSSEQIVSPQANDSVYTTRASRRLIANAKQVPFERYFQSVEIYTARRLKFPTDILNAYSGVLSTHMRLFGSESFYGLPGAIFDSAILWQPTAQTTRRDGFPSWSWAGWNGGVKWYGDTMELASYDSSVPLEMGKSMIPDWQREHTFINWYRTHESGELAPVWVPPASTATSSTLGYDIDRSTASNPYGRTRQVDVNMISHELSQVPTVPPSLINDQNLYFRAFSVRYQIKASGAYLRYGSIDPVWIWSGRLVFHILNKHSQVCGYVLLDESHRQASIDNPDASHEFLLLSDANYHCEWGRPHEQHPYKKSYESKAYIEYHAMMVNTRPDGVKERLGLARILHEAIPDAWGEGGWVDVVLG